MDAPKRYHPVHVTLHWLIAIGIFINLYLGIFVFSQRGRGGRGFQNSLSLQPIHIIVGVSILVFLLIRLVMRFTVKRPADATAGNKYLDILAKVVHYGLYLAVLTITIIGVVFSSQTGQLQSALTGSRPEFNRPLKGSMDSSPGLHRLPRVPFRTGRGDSFPVDAAVALVLPCS
jgi:cytochrome b561